MVRKNIFPVKVSKIGKWWRRETEIDVVGLENSRALAIEAKWSEISYQEAKKILSQLSTKARQIHSVEECILGVMAKRMEEKERIRSEGFIALDLQDIAKLSGLEV